MTMSRLLAAAMLFRTPDLARAGQLNHQPQHVLDHTRFQVNDFWFSAQDKASSCCNGTVGINAFDQRSGCPARR